VLKATVAPLRKLVPVMSMTAPVVPTKIDEGDTPDKLGIGL
jgi:hypothetical protein